MTRDFGYPAHLEPDGDGYVVTFRDLPEAITQGDDQEDAYLQAADALDEALAGRIVRREAIARPSAALAGEVVVPVPATTAAKAAVTSPSRRAGSRLGPEAAGTSRGL